ncbi:MAG: hypothetical protein H7330_11945 [Hymenobacteraceae bacterium]|nr:hypothetical protein [Hymenobacteraceae bacterium]
MLLIRLLLIRRLLVIRLLLVLLSLSLSGGAVGRPGGWQADPLLASHLILTIVPDPSGAL